MAKATASVLAEHFTDDGVFPNSASPALIYKGAVASAAGPDAFEQLFERNSWPPQWRSGVLPYHHYHSTAHEVLGIARGSATLILGGPKGRQFDVTAGDVIVIPAGVAHQRIDSSADFLVVGGYPPGQDWDLLKGEPGDRPRADTNITQVPKPTTDPVGGASGPLTELWR
jgi:uncharacterized protein YjlB